METVEAIIGLMIWITIIYIIVHNVKKNKQRNINQQTIENTNEEKEIIQEKRIKLKQFEEKILIPKQNSIYIPRQLLTANEQDFYNKIKGYIYEQGLHIITKIRLADLIEPKNNPNRNEWYSNFNKISSKHIDFAIVNNNMKVLFLIELDDSTHNYQDRQERDEFVNISLVNAGYSLLRVYNNNQGVECIFNYLKKNF